MKLGWCCTENWKPESSLKFLGSCTRNGSPNIKGTYFNIKVLRKSVHILLAVLLLSRLIFKVQVTGHPTHPKRRVPESFGLDLCSTNRCLSRIPPYPVPFSHPECAIGYGSPEKIDDLFDHPFRKLQIQDIRYEKGAKRQS